MKHSANASSKHDAPCLKGTLATSRSDETKHSASDPHQPVIGRQMVPKEALREADLMKSKLKNFFVTLVVRNLKGLDRMISISSKLASFMRPEIVNSMQKHVTTAADSISSADTTTSTGINTKTNIHTNTNSSCNIAAATATFIISTVTTTTTTNTIITTTATTIKGMRQHEISMKLEPKALMAGQEPSTVQHA